MNSSRSLWNSNTRMSLIPIPNSYSWYHSIHTWNLHVAEENWSPHKQVLTIMWPETIILLSTTETPLQPTMNKSANIAEDWLNWERVTLPTTSHIIKHSSLVTGIMEIQLMSDLMEFGNFIQFLVKKKELNRMTRPRTCFFAATLLLRHNRWSLFD